MLPGSESLHKYCNCNMDDPRDLSVHKWPFGSQSTTRDHGNPMLCDREVFQSLHIPSQGQYVPRSSILQSVWEELHMTMASFFEPDVQIWQAKYCWSAKGLAWSLNAVVPAQVVDLSLSSRGMQYHHLSRDSMATVYDLARIEGHFLTCWCCFSFLATF